jgi:hypothetical protein
MNISPNKIVHMEISGSGDISAGSAAALIYKQGIVITLGSTQGLVITDISIVTETACDLILAADSLTPGEYIDGGPVSANGGIVRTLQSHHFCKVGKIPKLFGAVTGKYRAILHGYMY